MNKEIEKEFNGFLDDYVQYLFGDKYKDKLGENKVEFWEYVCYCMDRQPSQGFLEQFQILLEWTILSVCRDFTNKTELRKFRKQLNWYYITLQNLSSSTRDEFKDLIDWGNLKKLKRQKVDKRTVLRWMRKLTKTYGLEQAVKLTWNGREEDGQCTDSVHAYFYQLKSTG